MQDFRKLRVWHLARSLALAVVEALPVASGRVVPGLRAQAIRAATSVGANIAEGCARTTRPEFLHFIEIAVGSLNELEHHLLLARDAKVITGDRHATLQRDLELSRRMLLALTRTLRQRIAEERADAVAAAEHRDAEPRACDR